MPSVRRSLIQTPRTFLPSRVSEDVSLPTRYYSSLGSAVEMESKPGREADAGSERR